MLFSQKGFVAIEPPKFEKIDARLTTGGLALNVSRSGVIRSKLIMNYTLVDHTSVLAGESALLPADSGLAPWAKKVYELDGQQFVLAPESAVLGFEVAE